jgi:type III restriction enzyme
MSTIEPKEYQSKAITKITDAMTRLLRYPTRMDRVVVLKSPTGSGKTLIAAQTLAALHRDPLSPRFIVLWLSPGNGDLHKQSARALTSMLDNSSLDVKLLDSRDDIVANAIPAPGTVFVVNWQKLRSQRDGVWSNRMVRPGETANLFTMLKNASDSGLDMVVVIDESHTQLDGPQTSALVAAVRGFRPFAQLEISATPNTPLDEELRDEGFHNMVVITFREVEAAGMVRRSALLNPEFADAQKRHGGDTLDVQVLWAAWERLEELTKQYADEDSPVKPLLLIQYPDGDAAVARADVVEKFLKDRGLVADVTYATWLSENHSPDLDKIAQNTSAYRALIFKQAIATGWDCPRAQVLVQFRKPGSETFQIQTLGRLMRTPEQKHYDNEDLNVAYVYSDLAGVTVRIVSDEPDFAIRDTPLTRGATYPSTGLKLRSVFQPRRRDDHYPDVATLEPVLKTELDKLVKPLLGSEPIRETRRDVLVDGSLDAIAIVGGGEAEFEGAFTDGVLGGQFVQALFDQLLTSKIGEYRSREQSRSRIKTILVKWFQTLRQWQPDEIQHFVLAHASEVSSAIDAACHTAAESEKAKAVAEARSKRRTKEDWEIPSTDLVVSKATEKADASGYLFDPALVPSNRSQPERRFEKWLGEEVKGGRVTWWWKNGVRDEKYLGIPYTLITPGTSETSEEITYPDYVVLTTAGEAWVIEVKDINDQGGAEGGVTSCKARGLRDWAKVMNKSREAETELLGLPMVRVGVVVPSDEGAENSVVKIGSADDWKPPTPANHSTGLGWTQLKFQGDDKK